MFLLFLPVLFILVFLFLHFSSLVKIVTREREEHRYRTLLPEFIDFVLRQYMRDAF